MKLPFAYHRSFFIIILLVTFFLLLVCSCEEKASSNESNIGEKEDNSLIVYLNLLCDVHLLCEDITSHKNCFNTYKKYFDCGDAIHTDLGIFRQEYYYDAFKALDCLNDFTETTECSEKLLEDCGIDKFKLLPHIDEACDYFCSEGLKCINIDGCKTCKKLPSSGQMCLQDRYCDEDNFCDSELHICFLKFEDKKECIVNEQCVSAYCNEGKCATLPSVDEPCVIIDSKEFCSSGLNCIDGLCKHKSKGSQKCKDSNDCIYSYACSEENICLPLDICDFSEVGEICLDNCREGHYCDPKNNTCKKFKELGESCQSEKKYLAYKQLADECGMNAYCHGEDLKICVKYREIGEDCFLYDCVEGAYCHFDEETLQRTCKKLKDFPQSCTFDFECLSKDCDEENNTCSALPCLESP